MSTTATNTTEFEAIVHVDPAALTLEDNVRTVTPAVQAKIDGFTTSAREIGIYTPLTGVRDELGNIMIRDGQCRLRAALAADLATVPVLIRRDDRTGQDREIGRTTEQLLANSAIAMHDDDVTAAIDQLSAFGVPVEQIAARSNLGRDRVAATVAATVATAGRNGVRSKVVEYELTLEQAITLLEFEDDEDALDRLARAAANGEFEHIAQTIRQERADAAARAAYEQLFRDRGIGILPRRPSHYKPTTPNGEPLHSLYGLVNADGQEATHADIAPERLWLYLSETETCYVRETGVEVDTYDVDWDYDRDAVDDDGKPWELEEGMHDPDTIETRTEWRIEVAMTTDPKADGLTKRPTNLPATADDADPEETAAKLAAAKEQKRHEHRRLLALNKAGLNAEVVRREYVTKLLTRKTPPKGAAKLTAHVINTGVFYKRITDGASYARELLGADHEYVGKNTLSDMIDKASEQRAQVLSLAFALGTFEQAYTKSSWRDDAKYIKPYLDFLITTGYTPATVETVITGERTPDEAFAAITEEATPAKEDQADEVNETE